MLCKNKQFAVVYQSLSSHVYLNRFKHNLAFLGWVSKVLGAKLLIPFSRATYCAYLAHSAIIQWVLFNMDAPIVMNRDLVVRFVSNKII